MQAMSNRARFESSRDACRDEKPHARCAPVGALTCSGSTRAYSGGVDVSVVLADGEHVLTHASSCEVGIRCGYGVVDQRVLLDVPEAEVIAFVELAGALEHQVHEGVDDTRKDLVVRGVGDGQ